MVSVTQFISRFSPKFDSDYWAQKKADEAGVTKDDILAEWEEKAKYACDLGTDVHEWIEDFYNGEKPPIPTEEERKSRIAKFARIHNARLKDLRPIKQELRIFSTRWKLAGTIDAIFHHPGKGLNLIGDWKTNKKFNDDSAFTFGNKLLYPFEDLADNHLNKYSIQISLYRLMLQEEVGYKTQGGFLCHIGPVTEGEIYKTKDLRARLKHYLDQNYLQLPI
jgi:ATP-dependent exoDNAse (exonuclease V) beta subunit